jgi:hypothetical protein
MVTNVTSGDRRADCSHGAPHSRRRRPELGYNLLTMKGPGLTISTMPLYTIPIAQRPSHGPLFSKIFFPIVFNLGQLGINSAQFLALPLLLIPIVGRRAFNSVIDYTKDGYGRLRERLSYHSL